MALVSLGPTRSDQIVARGAIRCARPQLQKTLQAVTTAADENVLLTTAFGLWVTSRAGNTELRQKADYVAVNVLASVLLPHLIKRLVDQRRPDRYIHGPRNGIPKSGKADDAFPSGHAVHVGTIAAAVSRQFPQARGTVWTAGLLLATTRVLLLAHWLSDVFAGLALGAALEHVIDRMWRPNQDEAK